MHKARPSDKMIAQGAFQREGRAVGVHQRAGADLVGHHHALGHDYAEPGIVFLDVINRDNNLRYCEP